MLINVARDAAGADASSDKDHLADDQHRENFQRIEPQLDVATEMNPNKAMGHDQDHFAASPVSAHRATHYQDVHKDANARHKKPLKPVGSSKTAAASSRFFMSPWRQTVLDTVRHLIALQQPVIWVTGVEGVGKSTLLQHFVGYLHSQQGEVLLLAAQEIADTASIYAWLWEKIQGTRSSNITLEVLLVALREFSQQRGQLRLLMDDVDQLTDAQIAELLRLQAALPVEHLQSILFAHPSVIDVCQAPACQMIDQSMAEWVDVPPFNLKETHQFIEFYCLQHQLPSPGWRVEKVKRLHTKTEGLPGKLVPILEAQGQAMSLFTQWTQRLGVWPWVAVIAVASGLLLWVVVANRSAQPTVDELVMPSGDEPINLAALSSVEPANVESATLGSVGANTANTEAVNADNSLPVMSAQQPVIAPQQSASVEQSSMAASIETPTAESQSSATQLKNGLAVDEALPKNVAIDPWGTESAPIAAKVTTDTATTKTFAQNLESTAIAPAASTEKVAAVTVVDNKVVIDRTEKPIPAVVASQWETVQAPAKSSVKAESVKAESVKVDAVKVEKKPTAVKAETVKAETVKAETVKAVVPVEAKTTLAKAEVVKPAEAIKPVAVAAAKPVPVKEVVAKDPAIKDMAIKDTTVKAVPVKEATKPAAFTTVNSAEQWEYRTWLMQRDPTHYTLQLLGSANKQRVLDFIQQFGPNSNAKLAYFPTLHEGQPWYVVIYGDFATAELAVAASPDVQPAMVLTDPWARSFGSIQSGVK